MNTIIFVVNNIPLALFSCLIFLCNRTCRQQIIGFRALSTLAFDINSTQAGAAIDAAIGAGANTINSVSFFADEATRNANFLTESFNSHIS